jgi:hypothetical protein
MELAFESAWMGIMKELPGYPALVEEQNHGEEGESVADTASYVKKEENPTYKNKKQNEG